MSKIGAQGHPPSEDFLRSLTTQIGDASTHHRPLSCPSVYTSRPEVDERPPIALPHKPEHWDSLLLVEKILFLNHIEAGAKYSESGDRM